MSSVVEMPYIPCLLYGAVTNPPGIALGRCARKEIYLTAKKIDRNAPKGIYVACGEVASLFR